MIREFEIACPECRGWILLDLETGEVLAHGKAGTPKRRRRVADDKGFDRAIEQVRDREKRGTDVFDDALRSVGDRRKKLEEEFEQARRRANEEPDDGRPTNPLDERFR